MIKKNKIKAIVVIAIYVTVCTMMGGCNSEPLSPEEEYQNWVDEQFSLDGSHITLEELIIDNLNDEESYKHIETNYREITDEETKDEVNNMLKESGFSERVDLNDLIIMTEFSADNVFGGTMKSYAVGISSYDDNMVTLVAVE